MTETSWDAPSRCAHGVEWTVSCALCGRTFEAGMTFLGTPTPDRQVVAKLDEVIRLLKEIEYQTRTRR